MSAVSFTAVFPRRTADYRSRRTGGAPARSALVGGGRALYLTVRGACSFLLLRHLVAHGMSQRQIAGALGVSQPAVSQQMRFAPAADHGYSRLEAFGSVERRTARPEGAFDVAKRVAGGERLGRRELDGDVLVVYTGACPGPTS